jgi:hypothetical protein
VVRRPDVEGSGLTRSGDATARDPPDHGPEVRSGLIAAGLAVFAAAALLTGGRADGAAVAHTCSATDRQFIRVAELNMVALGIWGANYREGSATAREVAGEAGKAAVRVDRLAPSDPSLKKAKTLVTGVFNEYGRAMAAKAKERDAAPHMYRAYGLANFAHDVLVDAAPELKRRGCDVSALL